MSALAARNASAGGYRSFVGAGSYDHFVPSAVNHLLSRTEFYSSYTPYQPEISQGTLQTIFEFQSMVCMLTGLDVSNASLYEGATALVEAILMAHRVHGRDEVVLAGLVHPEYRDTVRTYLARVGMTVVTVPHGPDGRVDEKALAAAITERTSTVAAQSPNCLGVIERLDRVATLSAAKGAAPIAVVAEPYSLGVLRGPGELGCDIAVGEGQGFGNGVSFGGPYVGFMGARQSYLRQMPGRIVGETTDVEGRRGFGSRCRPAGTASAAKATSNICTNQGCATAAAIHLALLGRKDCASRAPLPRRGLVRRGQAHGGEGITRTADLPAIHSTLPVPAKAVLEPLEKKASSPARPRRWDPARAKPPRRLHRRSRKADVTPWPGAFQEVL
jgi:glycine dehydrogenase subunit 1